MNVIKKKGATKFSCFQPKITVFWVCVCVFAREKITGNHNRCDVDRMRWCCCCCCCCFYCLLLSYSCYWWNTSAINGQSSVFSLSLSPSRLVSFTILIHSSMVFDFFVWRYDSEHSMHVLTCCDEASSMHENCLRFICFLGKFQFSENWSGNVSESTTFIVLMICRLNTHTHTQIALSTLT